MSAIPGDSGRAAGLLRVYIRRKLLTGAEEGGIQSRMPKAREESRIFFQR
jgi:hypothetical protein